MTTAAPTLPPPLSAPPSAATLQELLEALQQPMQRGVPTPPTPDRVFEQVTPDVGSPPSDVPAQVAPPVPLTWSAGRATHPRRTAAIAAVAVAAGAVAALVAAGELALP